MPRNLSGLFLIVVSISLISCENSNTSSEYSEQLIDVPPSFLSIDINLPIREVEQLLESNLKKELLKNKPVVLNDKKKDSLLITIKRYGDIKMSFLKGQLSIAMPLEVEAVISKKVLGMRLKNENNPVTFKAIASISADVDIDDNWDLILDCHWKSIKWVKKPVFSLLGLNFDLTDIIKEQIEKNAGELEVIICSLVNKKVDFAKTAAKIYHDIQKPNRITKKPFELYLSATPVNFKGELLKNRKDTISLHVELRTRINIGLEKNKPETFFEELPSRTRPLNQNNALSAFVEMRVTHDELKNTLNTIVAGRKFVYQDYEMLVSIDDVLSDEGKLKVVFSVAGDVNGQLSLTGYPNISEDLKLNFSSFEYELIDVDDDWVNITDFTLHEALEKYLEGLLRVDAFGFFEKVDIKAMNGIRKSKLGEKLDISLQFDAISPYQLRISKDEIQLILEVDGRAKIDLNKEVLMKKD